MCALYYCPFLFDFLFSLSVEKLKLLTLRFYGVRGSSLKFSRYFSFGWTLICFCCCMLCLAIYFGLMCFSVVCIAVCIFSCSVLEICTWNAMKWLRNWVDERQTWNKVFTSVHWMGIMKVCRCSFSLIQNKLIQIMQWPNQNLIPISLHRWPYSSESS